MQDHHHTRVSTVSTNPSPLDHTAHPHLLDAIVNFAPRDSLVAFRAVSRALRDRADRLLVDTVLITPDKVTTGDGLRIPRAKWWNDTDLLGCVRLVTIETQGGKWVMADGLSGPASASLLCLRAVCETWVDADSFGRQNDTMGVRLIRTRRGGPSGGSGGGSGGGSDDQGSAEPSRTAVLRLAQEEHPKYPSFQNIDKLVFNIDLGNGAYWRLDNDPGPLAAPEIVVHFANVGGMADLDEWDRMKLGRNAVQAGTAAVCAWVCAGRLRKPRLTFVGVEEVFSQINASGKTGFWPTVWDGFSYMMPNVPLDDALDGMAESITVAEYRARIGDGMFKLETEM